MFSRLRLRDLSWLVLLLLLPLAIVAALGLRALAGEEAAIGRQVEGALDTEARDRAERLRRTIDRAVELFRDAPAGAEAKRPPIGQIVRLDLAQQSVLHADAAPTPACREAIARDPRAARGLCMHARGESGRLLWPILAFAFGPPDPTETLAWIEVHDPVLGPLERALLRDDAAAAGLDAVVGRLERDHGGRSGVGALLESGALRTIAERATPATTSFEVRGGLGAMRRIVPSAVELLVVTRRDLEAAVVTPPPRPIPGIGAQVAVAIGSRGGPGGWAVVRGDLGVTTFLEDRTAVSRAAGARRRILGGLVFAGAALVVSGAALAVARVRAERRTAALQVDFVTAIGHELRTPIASIRMLAELLEGGRVPEGDLAEVHRDLAGEAKRTGETVERLLGFARASIDGLQLRREPTDLRPFLNDLVAAHEGRVGGAIARDLEDATVDVDRTVLRIAVENLLSNAAKYAGGATLVRSARASDAIVIEVVDRGPGVRRALRRKIFRAFERGDARLSRATEGLGIGLTLVAQAARAHGGRARVASTPGGGTTVSIEIPMRAESAKGAKRAKEDR
jgi:two-component system phosphate regulon sensor histidine kinase PhoR